MLALRSENITNKVKYELFYEKLETFIKSEFENGENIFEVIKDPSIDALQEFKINNKPEEATEEEKKPLIDTEIKKEEIKDYLKELKKIKSNLKKLYSSIYGSYTEGVHTMLKANNTYEKESKQFNYTWLLVKIKTIVLRLDTQVNLRVFLHATIMNFMLLKQGNFESIDAYLTRFKSMA